MADLKEILLSKNVIIPENFEIFKNIFRHFRGKEVSGIEGDGRPLLEKSSEFYLKPSSRVGFLQGDILDSIAPTWLAREERPEKTLSAFVSNPQLGMILSNECDCEQRSENAQAFIRICPVFYESQLIDELEIGKEKLNGFKGNLRANYYTEYFWMPNPSRNNADDNLIADISHIFSVSLTDLYQEVKELKVKKIISLSQDAYFLLLVKLAWLFLRPPAPDSIRTDLASWSFSKSSHNLVT